MNSAANANPEEEETELVRVDSWMHSAVPSIPKFFAVICLLFNILVPGLGTVVGGLMSCCCGRPRYNFRPATYRCPVAFFVMVIGVAQFLSAAFLLVGWLWSIVWGFLMVNVSGEEFRRVKTPPVKQKPGEKAEPTKPSNPEDPGRKNFNRIINKAIDNKEQAMGSGDNLPEDGGGSAGDGESALVDQNNMPLGNSSKGPSQVNFAFSDTQNSDHTLVPLESPTQGRNYFHNCLLASDTISRLFTRHRSASETNLLDEEAEKVRKLKSKEFNHTAHKVFNQWKTQALDKKDHAPSHSRSNQWKTQALDKKNHHAPSHSRSHHAHKNKATKSTATSKGLTTDSSELPLNPSQLQADMKPRLAHSMTYHFNV